MTGRIAAASGGLNGGSATIGVEGIQNAYTPPPGTPILVTHADGAFSLLKTVAVKQTAAGAEITLEEPPDFTVAGGKTEFKYYPVRTIDGQPSLEIVPVVSWAAGL